MVAKKKVMPRRIKTGLGAAPTDDFDKMNYYFHYELDKKDTAALTKTFIKENFSKDEAQAILACPEYHFYMYSHYAAGIYWSKMDLGDLPDKWSALRRRTLEYYHGLIEAGQLILKSKQADAEKPQVKVLTPQQRLYKKVSETIMAELDEVEDIWIDGGQPEFKMYDRMSLNDLKGQAVGIVRERVEGWLSDYSDAYNKTCEQAVEGYSHIKRPELKRRIKICEEMLLDLDRIKTASKATRKPRVKRPRAADKQIARLNYQKENSDFKLKSIPPINLIGAFRVLTFNTKTRELTEYVSNSTKGFEVKGTTLQNIDDASRKVRLRKPEEFLTIALNKTPKQIDNEWKKLTTKSGFPNGRINGDTILLRALDR